MVNCQFDARMYPKKLYIRSLKDVPTVDKEYCTTQLSALVSSILLIHTSLTPKLSYEELHRIVQDLISCNQYVELYETLEEVITDYLEAKVAEFLRCEKVDILEWMEDTWLNYTKHSKLVSNIYIWLDYSMIKDPLTKGSVWNLQLNLFKTIVVENMFIVRSLIEGLLAVIQSERVGQTVDLDKLKVLVKMLIDLKVYDHLFESKFLYRTDKMYGREGWKVLKEQNLVAYLYYIKEKMAEEKNRIDNYMSKSTKEPLMNIIKHRLISENISEMLKNVQDLFDEKLVTDINLLYSLLGLVNGARNELCKTFGEYLNKRGEEIVQDLTNEKNMMKELFRLKRAMDKLVCFGFENDKEFEDTVRMCFKYIINLRPNKCPELLAKYVDKRFRKKGNNNNTEDVLHEVLIFFRFILGKDIFSAFYKQYLSRRLLMGQSTSEDLENCMISKLKLECGADFTVGLEGMVTDIRLSEDINRYFKEYLKKNCDSGINAEISINVLTTSFWPSFHNFTVNLPNEIYLMQDVFQKFYVGKYNGRKLQWQQGLGQCLLKANFNTGRKELQVSILQACVLLLFNSVDQLTYTEIKEMCNLDDDTLKQNLQVLCHRTSRILRKSPPKVDIGDAHVFTFNSNFTAKLFRVKINSLQMKQTAEKIKFTEKGVHEDRQYQIDAAIVRIMKHKKVLEHKSLVGQLYEELKIPVTLTDVKKRIEVLIERDYIERDPCNQAIYKYVA